MSREDTSLTYCRRRRAPRKHNSASVIKFWGNSCPVICGVGRNDRRSSSIKVRDSRTKEMKRRNNNYFYPAGCCCHQQRKSSSRASSSSSCSSRGSYGPEQPPSWCVYLAVGLVAVGAYLNSLGGDFVHDDIPAIVRNKDVLAQNSLLSLLKDDFWGVPMHDPSSHKSYRPLTTLSFRYV